jgi:aspartate aminotransferase-like enzyme
MFLTLEKFGRAVLTRPSLRQALPPDGSAEIARASVNLLPGPVDVSPAVLGAFARPSLSHRSEEFIGQLAALRRRLAALVRSNDVQIFPGSGTLANDAVAAQLTRLERAGLVISTGEFGERLADHARRAGLNFHHADYPWGTPIDQQLLSHALADAGHPRWLWLVHHETSTGVMHDLSLLKAFARTHSLALCLDCISTIGAIPVDLTDVNFASATSSKGLAAPPGLGIVFHSHPPAACPDRPRYLDLALWAAADSVAFTHSSNLINALDLALAEIERLPSGGRCAAGHGAAFLRQELAAAGFLIVAPEPFASPIVVTVQLPASLPTTRVGEQLEGRGFLTSYRSRYLTGRNWIQFCLIGAPAPEALSALVAELSEVCGPILNPPPSPAPLATPSSTRLGN